LGRNRIKFNNEHSKEKQLIELFVISEFIINEKLIKNV